MTAYIDHNDQLHLTFEKSDCMTELDPPTWLLTAEQTEQLREILGVRKADEQAAEKFDRRWLDRVMRRKRD